jgi:hypothetical protein
MLTEEICLKVDALHICKVSDKQSELLLCKQWVTGWLTVGIDRYRFFRADTDTDIFSSALADTPIPIFLSRFFSFFFFKETFIELQYKKQYLTNSKNR